MSCHGADVVQHGVGGRDPAQRTCEPLRHARRRQRHGRRIAVAPHRLHHRPRPPRLGLVLGTGVGMHGHQPLAAQDPYAAATGEADQKRTAQDVEPPGLGEHGLQRALGLHRADRARGNLHRRAAVPRVEARAVEIVEQRPLGVGPEVRWSTLPNSAPSQNGVWRRIRSAALVSISTSAGGNDPQPACAALPAGLGRQAGPPLSGDPLVTQVRQLPSGAMESLSETRPASRHRA
jgi:hypothetical protein